MTFYVENEVDADFGFDIEELANSVANTVLKMEGCTAELEVGLTITDSRGIHELNRSSEELMHLRMYCLFQM